MKNWLRNDPRTWDPDTLNRPALYDAAQDLQGHPQFSAARQAFAQRTFHGPWELVKVMRSAPPFALLASILHLHHRREVEVHGSGVTVAGVIEIFSRGAAHGEHCFLASPTRIKSIMSLICHFGGLSPVDHSGDRRVKLLAPTDRLIEPAKRWLREFLQIVHCVLPLPVESMDVPNELLGEILSYNICAYADAGFILYEEYPEIRQCMAREAGYRVLMHLLSVMRTNIDGVVSASTPFERMSEQFKVARGTIRNVFSHLSCEGYLDIERGGHHVILKPHFIALCDRWIALELTWMHGMALAAWRNIINGRMESAGASNGEGCFKIQV